ncbi:hypothetical protein BHY_1582 (plasmid) [Borrelia nietonii YOR]|uniref:Uncharacterized protein n=1 Tax=Borrelia nietonii YOR TaxID=1293576 RepID=W5SC71_9SPIR|nr:hypothetical protein BHY_1582 [Borrelia nietonii YOR]
MIFKLNKYILFYNNYYLLILLLIILTNIFNKYLIYLFILKIRRIF